MTFTNIESKYLFDYEEPYLDMYDIRRITGLSEDGIASAIHKGNFPACSHLDDRPDKEGYMNILRVWKKEDVESWCRKSFDKMKNRLHERISKKRFGNNLYDTKNYKQLLTCQYAFLESKPFESCHWVGQLSNKPSKWITEKLVTKKTPLNKGC